MMLNGSRTTGVKFLSKKTAPYQKLHVGDVVYLKDSSGPIRGRVNVGSVENVEFVEPEQIMQFLSEHSQDIGIESEEQLMAVWKGNANSRYLCWWKMSEPQYAKYPISIHKNDRRAWIANYNVPEEILVAFL